MRTSLPIHSGAMRLVARLVLASAALCATPAWTQLPIEPSGTRVRTGGIQLEMSVPGGLMESGTNVYGAVVDAEFRPLADAYVELRPLVAGSVGPGAFGAERTLHTRTDAQGDYQFAAIPPGAYVLTVMATADPEFADADFDECARSTSPHPCSDTLASSRFVTVVEELPPKSTLTVGRSLAVPLGADPGGGFRGRLTGAFDPEHYAYEVTFTIAHNQHGKSEHLSGPTTAEGRTGVEFGAIPNADGSFDFGGMPLKQFDSLRVNIWPLVPLADAPPRFDMPPVLLHRQPLVWRDPELGPPVEIEIPVMRTVRVHLVDRPEDLRAPPFAGLTLKASPADRHGTRSSRKLEVGVDVVDLLLPVGEYSISASQDGHRAVAPRVELAPGDDPLELRLVLVHIEPIEFEVVDTRGDPIDGAFLDLEAGGDDFAPVSTTVEHGRARLEYVEPGTYPALLILADGTNYEFELSVGPEMEPLVIAR